jgi:hypothetical protein
LSAAIANLIAAFAATIYFPSPLIQPLHSAIFDAIVIAG